MLASSLNDMFENLEIHEDCYGVGHFAKVVASELANLPSAKARRKVRRISKIIPLFTSIKMVFLCILKTVEDSMTEWVRSIFMTRS